MYVSSLSTRHVSLLALFQIAIDGLSRLLCMEQAKQVIGHRRRKSSKHVAVIRPPPLPINNWEPPPYQMRDSPTTNDAATEPAAATTPAKDNQQQQQPLKHVAVTGVSSSNYVCTYYRRYRQPELSDAMLGAGTTQNQRQLRRVVLQQQLATSDSQQLPATSSAVDSVDMFEINESYDNDTPSQTPATHSRFRRKLSEQPMTTASNWKQSSADMSAIDTCAGSGKTTVVSSSVHRKWSDSKSLASDVDAEKIEQVSPSQPHRARLASSSSAASVNSDVTAQQGRRHGSPPPTSTRRKSSSTGPPATKSSSSVLCNDCRLAAVAAVMKSTSNYCINGHSATSGAEVGLAVETEVKEVRRMLRSFMAKLSMRDIKEKNALEWRTVALAIDRLFFCIYLVIILLALGAIFPWQEALATPRFARIFTTASRSRKN